MNTNIFRTLAIGVSIFSALTFVPTQIAFAQNPGSTAPGVPGFTLTFDEQGNSLLNGGPNPNPVVPSSLGGLQFTLPQTVTPGTVLVRAQHDSTVSNPLGDTDVLLFFDKFDAAGIQHGFMTYQSLIDDTDTSVDLADVNAFVQFPLPVPTINEFGVEGNNRFQWIPDPNNASGAVYNGISDGRIPEPSTFALGSLGLLSLAALAYRRRRLTKAV